MTTFATCDGIPVVSGEITVPLWRMWTADLQLATDTPVSGSVTVTIGNLSLQGFVYRSVPFAGQTSARVVAGYGGWRSVQPAKQYSNSNGVMLSMIAMDLGLECGEQVSVPNDTSVGTGWVRTKDKASAMLRVLTELGWIPGWYVDTSGMTQLAEWPSVVVGSDFQVIDQKPDVGLVTVATEDYASWLPGATFSGPTLDGTFAVGGVTYRLNNDGILRLEVLTQ